MKKLIVLTLLAFATTVVDAQPRGPIPNPSPGVMDGIYIPENVPTKKVIPYEYVREADVMWSKRVWRVIDLREKFNHPLHFPLDDYRDGDGLYEGEWMRNPTRWSLWTIIRYHVMTGALTLYSPFDPDWQQWTDGDMFKYPITSDKYGLNTGGNFLTDSIFREYIKGMEYIGKELFDPNPAAMESLEYPGEDSIDFDGNVVYYPAEFQWYKSGDVVQYRLKEDWFFDKERSVMDVRIIGICPVIYNRDQNGNIMGFKELFWLYFPECRYVFQNFFVQNRHNDSQRMSFDDLFWKRMFHSYISKESNVYDRDIDSYKSGVDALLESEKIKEKITNFEHDLWSF